MVAPWVALAYDGSPAAAAEAERVLDEVQLATLPPQGTPAGPDYQQYWIDRVRRGWPGCGRCRGPAASTGPAGGRSWSPGC